MSHIYISHRDIRECHIYTCLELSWANAPLVVSMYACVCVCVYTCHVSHTSTNEFSTSHMDESRHCPWRLPLQTHLKPDLVRLDALICIMQGRIMHERVTPNSGESRHTSHMNARVTSHHGRLTAYSHKFSHSYHIGTDREWTSHVTYGRVTLHSAYELKSYVTYCRLTSYSTSSLTRIIQGRIMNELFIAHMDEARHNPHMNERVTSRIGASHHTPQVLSLVSYRDEARSNMSHVTIHIWMKKSRHIWPTRIILHR